MLLLGLCVGPSLEHGQHPPPGVPEKVYPEGHAPPGHNNFGTNVHDAEHIKEHLKDVVDKPKEEMSEEELEFHYFKLHDYDDNNKLDGTEVVKAITHFHADEETQEKDANKPEAKVFSDEEIANIVDMVLKEDDINNDGYIEYVEFITAQRKARGGGD